MLNIKLKNLFWVSIALFCATQFCSAQSSEMGPTVDVPASRPALIDIGANANQDLSMGREYKSTKNVITPEEKPTFLNWYGELGYESEYNFRGTNLTPNADGAGFIDVELSKWGFTLGVYGIHQFGTADAPGFSLGEGGGGSGGGVGHGAPGFTYAAETVQKHFDEVDVFLQYHHDFGPVELTVGNIGFFIQRDAQTFLDITSPFPRLNGRYGPYPTVEDEEFDRVFVRLATSIIPHIQPWITYYQTIYNNGQDHNFYLAPHIPPNGTFVFYGRRDNDNFIERNEELGGYLEARVRGNFPIGQWIDINPYWIISYSLHDRTEPIPDATRFKDILRGRSLVGWNHTQFGLELPIHLVHFTVSSTDVRLNLVPFGAYSYHISTPPAGTDRNEWWGGVKFTATF